MKYTKIDKIIQQEIGINDNQFGSQMMKTHKVRNNIIILILKNLINKTITKYLL